MAECELPSACPECGARAPRVLLTAPGCLTMSAEGRQAGAKFERLTDGLHDPGKLHGPGCSCCVGRVSKMARRAKARASRPAWLISRRETRRISLEPTRFFSLESMAPVAARNAAPGKLVHW